MPKLSAVQWLIVAAFQVFYGFAVFALTRDYYQRQAPINVVQSQPAAQSPHQRQPVHKPIQREYQEESLIPESVVQKDPVLMARLGDERFAQKRYGEAIEIYRRTLEMAPDDVDTHNDLGLALHYSGNSEAALAALKKGVEVNPRFQRIWLTLGFVQLNTEESDQARFAFMEAINLGADTTVGQEAKRMLDQLDGS